MSYAVMGSHFNAVREPVYFDTREQAEKYVEDSAVHAFESLENDCLMIIRHWLKGHAPDILPYTVEELDKVIELLGITEIFFTPVELEIIPDDPTRMTNVLEDPSDRLAWSRSWQPRSFSAPLIQRYHVSCEWYRRNQNSDELRHGFTMGCYYYLYQIEKET